MHAPTAHRSLHRLTASAPWLILASTVAVFAGDLYLESGFVPWLFYFLLAFVVSRLYSPLALYLASTGWSVLILAALALSHSGSFATGLFNRAMGLAVLWILVFLMRLSARAETGRSEQALRMRAMLDGALDAVVEMDRSGRILEWSPQAERVFGFPRDQAVGAPLAALIIPPRYREAHAEGMRRYLATGTPKILNKRIDITALHRDGREFPVELTVIPLHFGNDITFSAFLRDLTDQKRADEELRNSRTFLDSIVEHLPNMVFVKDAKELRFVRFNKAGEELIGVPESALIRLNDYDLFPKEQADFFTAKDRAVLESGRMTVIPEEPISTKHKGERILHTKKIPILDHEGRPRYLLGISEDITERKQAEDLLRRSQEAAEAANKAKSEFLANVSHEIRTPLNAVLGTLDLLSDSAATKEQWDYAMMGKRAGSVLLHLVNDLLDLAKAEAGTLRIDCQPLDLRDLLSRTQAMMAPRAQAKGLALRVTLDDVAPAQIMGDATRLQQILLNLIGNAVKFTEQGHVTCSVAPASSEQSSHGVLQFTVADSGIGIPPEHCDRIFERFTQIDSGDNRKYGGTGLGLSICRQLVELMGGRIWVESDAGRGSRFFFTLPYRLPEEDLNAHSESGRRLPPPDSEASHILFVDDFQETLQLARAFLQRLPCQLDTADNGEEAVARCRLYRYDAVLMDMQMPGMDGYAATAAIRAYEREHNLSPVPIIAVTADVLAPARERSAASGCTSFLEKPFTRSSLLEVLQRHLAPRRPPVASRFRAPSESDFQPLRHTFLKNRRRDIEVLTAALAAGDFASIAVLGHRMKGLAGSHGFDEIGRVGAALEQAAGSHDREAIEREIQHLRRALAAADVEPGRAA